jgi:hypothetical protein
MAPAPKDSESDQPAYEDAHLRTTNIIKFKQLRQPIPHYLFHARVVHTVEDQQS